MLEYGKYEVLSCFLKH